MNDKNKLFFITLALVLPLDVQADETPPNCGLYTNQISGRQDG